MLPDRKEIIRLLETHRVPGHIMEHSRLVCMVALSVGRALRKKGHDIDLGLIEASSLLHDICKMECIESGGDHARMGEEVLRAYGYPRVGEVVGQHVRLRTGVLNEAMVVNYADKRVMHTEVVTLRERFSDLEDRYGTDGCRKARIRENFHASEDVERIIADACGMDPGDLERLGLVPFDEALDGG
jgi:hypothetical protein